MRRLLSVLLGVALGFALGVSAVHAQTPSDGRRLAGSAWQLVRFEGGDGKVFTPDDRTKYTMEFRQDGALVARIDCNRGGQVPSSRANRGDQPGHASLNRARHSSRVWPQMSMAAS